MLSVYAICLSCRHLLPRDEDGRHARKVFNDRASAAVSLDIVGDAILVLMDREEKCYAFKPHV